VHKNQIICGTTPLPVQITSFVKEVPESLNLESINPLLTPNSSTQYIIISLDHLPQELENLFLNSNIDLGQQSSDIFSSDLSSFNTPSISTPMVVPMQLNPTYSSATEEEPNYMTEPSLHNLDEDATDANLPEEDLDHMVNSLDFKQLEKFINLAIKEGRYVIKDVPKGVEMSSQH